MNRIKNLFALKKGNEEDNFNEPDESEIIKRKLTFFESGYGSSKQAEGNHVIFKACLQEVYMDFKRKCREDEKMQNDLNRPYLIEIGKNETELKKRKTAKSIIEENISKYENEIKTFKDDMVNVRRDPENYGLETDKRPKAQFYLGLFVLIPITFYLIVFYISASYSAFFKNFDTNALSAAIFDGNALNKAINDGWLEGVFVATIPFAFMGLGYLIHMFLKNRHYTTYLKVGVLYAVTFIFDAILAYQIEKKIYDIEKTPDSPTFDLQLAFTKVEFWGIIFAGFVVYIIWGLVFDFIMKEYENFDKIKAFIRTKKEDIKNRKSLIAVELEKLNPLKEEISGYEGKIIELQKIVDGFIFANKEYLTFHTEYVKGWFLAIADNFDSLKRRDQLLAKCVEMEKQHLLEHDVHDEDYENKLYKLAN